MAWQGFIKCKRNNNNANSKTFFLNFKIKKVSKVYIVGIHIKLIWRLVWNQMKLVLCSILAVIYYVRLCLIGKIFGWVRLSSSTEPNRSQSNDWKSIGFDWLHRAHFTMNQVIVQIKRDIFTKEILVLNIKKNMPAHLTNIKRMVQGRFTQRFLKNKKNWLNLM